MTIDEDYDSFMGRTSTTTQERGAVDYEDGDEIAQTALALRGSTTDSTYSELVKVAREVPRLERKELIERAREVGKLLGETAYYSYPVGDGRAEGPTIDLMDALASEWGRIVTAARFVEQTRKDRVHLRGLVIDLMNVNVVERPYVGHMAAAPGKFASKPDQVARWETMQLQSNASKAVRNALEHAWFQNAAVDAAKASVSDDILIARDRDGKVIIDKKTNKPVRRELQEAREIAARALFDRFKVTTAELEGWLAVPLPLWTVEEIKVLRQLYADLRNGRATVEQVKSAGTPPTPPTGSTTTTSSAPSETGHGLDDGPDPVVALADQIDKLLHECNQITRWQDIRASTGADDRLIERAVNLGVRERGWTYDATNANGRGAYVLTGKDYGTEPAADDKRPRVRPPNPELDARDLLAALGGDGWKIPVVVPGTSKDGAKGILKGALNPQPARMEDGRVRDAVQWGVDNLGWRWNGDHTAVLPPASSKPEPTMDEMEEALGSEMVSMLCENLGLVGAYPQWNPAQQAAYREGLRAMFTNSQGTNG